MRAAAVWKPLGRVPKHETVVPPVPRATGFLSPAQPGAPVVYGVADRVGGYALRRAAMKDRTAKITRARQITAMPART